MIIYLAVSADTTTGNAAYAYEMDNRIPVTRKETFSTGPRELLRALVSIFDTILKEELYNKVEDFIIITNNQYITKMIMEDQITQWKNNHWIKSNGDAISSQEFLYQIYNQLQFFKERNVPIYLQPAASTHEISRFKGISKLALNKRKF